MSTENIFQGMLYTKAFTGKNGNRFVKFFLKVEDKTFDVVLKNTLKARITAEGWGLPATVTINDSDYFIKSKKYTRKDGTEGKAYEIVILDIVSHQPTEFKSLKIEDLI